MRCVVFDIDGTLADLTHRRHFVATKPKNWPAFERGLLNDTVFSDIVELLLMHYTVGTPIVLASGRGAQSRADTEKWLRESAGLEGKYQKLYMRAEGDYRADDIVKAELLAQMRNEGYHPYLAYDDRDRVVKMWRENGVRCLQVAPGAF